MAHGTPDWGVTAGGVTTYQLTDLAEQAVRLGSIHSFDRRGDVVYLDSFEEGFEKWEPNGLGSGSRRELTINAARTGQFALLLVTGQVLDGFAQVKRYFFIPVESNIGLEFSVSFSYTLLKTAVLLTRYTGALLYEFEARYNGVNDTLEVLTTGSVYTVVASSVAPPLRLDLFNTIKLVVDPRTGKYVRLLFNELKIDLTAHTAPVSADSTAPQLQATLKVTGDATSTHSARADDFILTQNEPA